MAKMYYVCNHVDKIETQFSTLEAAKRGYDHAVYEMIKKINYMFESKIDGSVVMEQVAALFYIKQVDYIREEVVYEAKDLEGVEENE